MKKIKIYLQYPWEYSNCSYYEYLKKSPPKSVSYIDKNISNVKTDKKDVRKIFSFKNKARTFLRKIKIGIPIIKNPGNAEADLIFSAHSLIRCNKPWVMELEYNNQFIFGPVNRVNKLIAKKFLSSRNCKKILTWSKWAKGEFLKEYPELKNKTEVLYPAIEIPKFKKIPKKEIILLFVSRLFYFKGGLHAVEIMDRLTKKYENVKGFVVSDTPIEIMQRYSTNKNIKFLGLVNKDKLMKDIFPNADIFLYPSYTDTFGFAILEAMSFGLPVVSVEGQSREELIADGKTGFIIKEPKKWCVKNLENIKDLKDTIKEIERKTELLIKDKKLREKMGKAGRKEVAYGKFSIKNRNEKLRDVYEEALK